MDLPLADRMEALELLVISHLHAMAQRDSQLFDKTSQMAYAHADVLEEDGNRIAARLLREHIATIKLRAN